MCVRAHTRKQFNPAYILMRIRGRMEWNGVCVCVCVCVHVHAPVRACLCVHIPTQYTNSVYQLSILTQYTNSVYQLSIPAVQSLSLATLIRAEASAAAMCSNEARWSDALTNKLNTNNECINLTE